MHQNKTGFFHWFRDLAYQYYFISQVREKSVKYIVILFNATAYFERDCFFFARYVFLVVDKMRHVFEYLPVTDNHLTV